MADTACMMYSIYVTSVIRYDSFVALASKNVPSPYCRGMAIIYTT